MHPAASPDKAELSAFPLPCRLLWPRARGVVWGAAGADDAAGDGSQPSFCFPPSSGARDGSETADDAAASGYEADSDGDGDVSSADNAPRRIEHPCPGCHADDVRGASNELDHLVDGLLGNPVHPQCRLRALFFM